MTIPAEAGEVLLPLARRAIERATGAARPCEPGLPAWTRVDGASFVTLHLDGRLRGCIGSLTAYRSLSADVSGNARAAALTDPRFPPVAPEEVDRLHLEVSVLTPAEPMTFTSEHDAVTQLRPHVDGLVLEALGRRGTYLPQVWDQIPEPADFLESLKRKAGMPVDAWPEGVRLSRYTVAAWEEDR